ncbi:MAG TPA: hypothetical protein VD902_00885 [Symbiobacteriaceae bacterium]|nr:hypothetical protein [Symbiobacteriaceae bacterium]
MRIRILVAALAVVAQVATTGAAASPEPIPADKGAWLIVAAGTRLPGDQAALEAAMEQPSPIHYKILVTDDAAGEDRTAYLDRVAQTWAQPAENTLLLVIFTAANNDIRFFMGHGFRQQGVTVDEMLGLVRTLYLPVASKGDAAGALAGLIRAVNTRMGARAEAKPPQVMPQSPQATMRTLLTHLQHGDIEALTALVAQTGDAAQQAELTLRLLAWGGAPRVIGYRLAEQVDVIAAREGGKPVKLTLGKEGLTVRQMDRSDELEQELQSYRIPFAWMTLSPGTKGASNITHDREVEEAAYDGHFTSGLDIAQAHMGPGIALPPSLDHQPIYLFTATDKLGAPVATGVSSPETGFWVRHRPRADHRVAISWGSDIQAAVTDTIVAGRPARIIRFSAPKGPLDTELWLDEGPVVYELRAPGADASTKLMKLAESMQ